MPNNEDIAIGIDLGTTYSCVAVMQNGKVEVIANDMGNRTTPSYVAFTPTERLIGEAAKNQATQNPNNTIFDAKRLIGKKFNDKTVQDDMKHFPFRVLRGDNDNPEIEATYKEQTKRFKPEEISAAVLTKMKSIAEAYLGHPVRKAVVTVPAYFNNAQRQSTKDAGSIAGLDVLRIINEPTAAAIAYRLEKPSGKDKNVLIFDLGGGTFDVSVLAIDSSGLIEVMGTSGNTHLGGEDFDNLVVDYFVGEFKKKSGVDISNNKRALRRLRTQCEMAKRTLSSSTTADINIDSLADGIDFSSKLTRANFERLCDSKFKECIPAIEDALKPAKISKSEIDEIVLVGGSTRIPKIKEIIKEYFNGKEPNSSINPDEAVAYGAAVQAAILSGHDTSDVCDNITLVDVCPLSLGVKEGMPIFVNGKMDSNFEKVIERGKKIPCKKSKIFSTGQHNQTEVKIEVYEGERKLVSGNNLLGSFNIAGIPPMPRGQPQIEITFDLDQNGILNVTAVEKASGKTGNIVITNSNKMSKQEIDRMTEEAEKFAEDDRKVAELIESKNKFENFIFGWKSTIDEDKVKKTLSADEIKQISDILEEAEKWSQEHMQEQDKEVYDNKVKEMEKIIMPLVQKMYGNMGAMPGETNECNDDCDHLDEDHTKPTVEEID